MFRLAFKNQFAQIGHALRIKNTIKVIAFMLDHAGMETPGDTLDYLAVESQTLIPDVGVTLDPTAKAGNGQASFPAAFPVWGQDFNLRVHQHGQGRRVVEHLGLAEAWIRTACRRLKNDEAYLLMHLWSSQSCSIGIDHGFNHVLNQAAKLGIGQVGDRFGHKTEHGMAHSRDFSDRHRADMSRAAAPGKGGQRRIRLVTTRPLEGWLLVEPPLYLLFEFDPEVSLQIVVRDNNVDQALKALKKKMQREGLFREMKLRNHYEKPSEKRAREKAEAVRRARKLHRKKLQREGLLPKTPKVVRPGRP